MLKPLEAAARYANQRIAFGKPIGFNQMIQEKLALMKVKCMNTSGASQKSVRHAPVRCSPPRATADTKPSAPRVA